MIHTDGKPTISTDQRVEDQRNAARIRGQLAESSTRFLERGERMTGMLQSDDPAPFGFDGELTDIADMAD